MSIPGTKTLSVPLSIELDLLNTIETARGTQPRSAYIRDCIRLRLEYDEIMKADSETEQENQEKNN